LPLSLQPKLLRVLQEHTFERVGGTASIHADVRVIAATNRRPLEDGVEQKTFRADLYYRLNAFTVRELEHLIERAAVKAGGRAITAEQIQEELTKAKNRGPGTFDIQSATALPFHEAVANWERHLIDQALKASHGNKSDAARRLGMHRRLLYEKLAQFGML
jgi:transcriptional regulator with GAF, ATPase, and Fis domain